MNTHYKLDIKQQITGGLEAASKKARIKADTTKSRIQVAEVGQKRFPWLELVAGVQDQAAAVSEAVVEMMKRI